MFKKKINAPLYMLFAANCIYAATNGISWIFITAAILTGIVLILDITEAIQNGKEKQV